jgi:hypothetical protein
MLQLTVHAIERFMDRWRPGVPEADAREELQELARKATPTRRKTLTRNAWLYRVETEQGECICLAVRDGTIITVLPQDNEGRPLLDLTPDDDMLEESRATVAACRALVAAEAPFVAEQKRLYEAEKSMKANALILIREGRAGTRKVSALALGRAYTLLGISAGDPLPGDKSPPAKPLPERPPTPADVARIRCARELIADWERGNHITAKALRRAFAVLGLPVPDKRP